MLILLCEDDELLRTDVAHVLAENGHVVLEAAGGADALALMRAEQPDLVLLDLTLEGGLEVAASKKLELAIAHIPTLILSGRPAAALSDLLLIVAKPVTNEKLLRVVDHIEALKRLERGRP
jgi:CheY-like chemotaxis protein